MHIDLHEGNSIKGFTANTIMEDHCPQTSQLTTARRFPTVTCPEKKDARIVCDSRAKGHRVVWSRGSSSFGRLNAICQGKPFLLSIEMAIFLGLDEKLPEAFLEVASG